MGKKELLLLEEQTLLSRERTMQQYIATGTAMIGLGIFVIKFFPDMYYYWASIGFILFGFFQIAMAYIRFQKYRKVVRKLRKKEKKLKLDVGE